jgi:poly(hydroxyalkanoate) granule-associated protein
MVKKLKQMADKKAASSGLFDSALASQVKDSAQQIWLAGMGAFAKAQAASLQKKTQSAAEERLGDVTGRMTTMAGDVQAKAGQHWDKLESIFEERTAKALKRLGVPSAKEMQALVARIDELNTKVTKLAKSSSTATRKSAASNGAARAATKRSATRKSA